MAIIHDNDNFCNAPWMTIHVEPNGSASPCCLSSSTDPDTAAYGNLHTESFTKILHGDKLKAFRKSFMNNEKPERCSKCWQQEELHGKHSSLRNNYNKNRFREEHFLETKEDGTWDDFKITYWDFRPSNRCNLSCLTCCSELSSSVWQLRDDLGYSQHQKKFAEISDDRFEEIFSMMKHNLATLPHDQEIPHHFYFAGGEPLQIPHHHRILEHLVENEYFDVSLRYNTNLTTLKYKKTNWIDIWKKFNRVVIDVSIDAAGKAGEFQRYGSNWSVIKENIRQLHDAGITVTFNIVVTMITYPAILDTIKELEEIFDREYLNKATTWNGTMHPDILCLNMTPSEFLDTSVVDKMDEMGYKSGSVRGVLSLYDKMNSDENALHARWKNLIDLNKRLRSVKEVGFNDVLPWFDDYVNARYNK